MKVNGIIKSRRLTTLEKLENVKKRAAEMEREA
jgi:hypothetical protein